MKINPPQIEYSYAQIILETGSSFRRLYWTPIWWRSGLANTLVRLVTAFGYGLGSTASFAPHRIALLPTFLSWLRAPHCYWGRKN